VTYRLLSVLFM